ncbi:MAG: histidine phosphatase family protein [Gammaproteobacteria bacterium]|nr:histidine phosphatase family protein [Gammaproteobacteria bacterium]
MNRSSTYIDLIRHGEPEGGKRYRGQIDDPLSDTGWRQMWEAVGEQAPWQQIVTSPLARCHAFAAALAARHALPLAVDARLMEIGFGVWEGRTAEQLRAEDPEQIARFYHDPVNARPSGAEPLEAFRARVAEGFHALANVYAGRRVLVVCHAGVMRAVVAQVLNAPLEAIYRIDVAYAAITRIKLDGERPPMLVSHAGCRL